MFDSFSARRADRRSRSCWRVWSVPPSGVVGSTLRCYSPGRTIGCCPLDLNLRVTNLVVSENAGRGRDSRADAALSDHTRFGGSAPAQTDRVVRQRMLACPAKLTRSAVVPNGRMNVVHFESVEARSGTVCDRQARRPGVSEGILGSSHRRAGRAGRLGGHWICVRFVLMSSGSSFFSGWGHH